MPSGQQGGGFSAHVVPSEQPRLELVRTELVRTEPVSAEPAPRPSPNPGAAPVPAQTVRAQTVRARPNLLSAFGRSSLRLLPGLTSIAAVIGLWWAASYFRLDSFVRFVNIPTPGQVFESFGRLMRTDIYWLHIAVSIRRVVLGFLLAAALAIPLGIVCAMSQGVRRFLVPVVELFRPIPAIAWVPISIMLWATNEGSMVFITFIGAFFPAFVNTFHGAMAIDETYVRAALCHGARRRHIFLEVMLPGALPDIVTGLTLGIGVCWISVIAAEMVSGQFGIGYFTWEAYSLIMYQNIIVGMISIGILGLGSSAVVRHLGGLMIPWKRA